MKTVTGAGGRGPAEAKGWLQGFLGVLIFGGSLPATRVAVADFEPLFLTGARATLAGLLALLVLRLLRQPWPGRADWRALAVTAFGVVLGYAQGARLARRLGGWQVISWSLVLAWPVMAGLSAWTWPTSWAGVGWPAWWGLAYVSLFSMFIGFVFWYRGLALGGIAAVGQLQLLQPFIGLGLAAVLLHEEVSTTMWLATLAAVLCVAGARRHAPR